LQDPTFTIYDERRRGRGGTVYPGSEAGMTGWRFSNHIPTHHVIPAAEPGSSLVRQGGAGREATVLAAAMR